MSQVGPVAYSEEQHDCRTHGISRRRILGSFGALGAAAVLPGAVLGQAPARRLIDVHFHMYPPDLQVAMQARQTAHGLGPLPPFVRNWSPATALEEMDRTGTVTSVLSLASAHGNWYETDRASWGRLSRSCNEFAAAMIRDHPGRFGLFASLPMPDVEASLKEIAYALDVLKADGIGLATSFGDLWPGDKRFAPVFEELNRRKAMVVFHPYAPNCCGSNLVPEVAESYLEYPYDTGRCVFSLLFSGTLARLHDIRWTFCHAGGPVPIFASRIATLSKNDKLLAAAAPNGVEFELKRLYFDTANAGRPALDALLDEVAISQVMFGTDWPYVSGAQNAAAIEALNLPRASLEAIQRGNAMRLIPRLRA